MSRKPPAATTSHLVIGLLVVGALAGAVYAFGANINFDPWIRRAVRGLLELRGDARAHPAFAVMVYWSAYVVLVSLSVPGAMWLTVVGGFLFGLIGFVYALTATTLGAVITFLLARHVFHRWIAERKSRQFEDIKKGFGKSAFNYLLVLRLMPGCPFVVVNLAAAPLPIKTFTFFGATLLGMIPATLAEVLLGEGLSEVAALGKITMSDLALNPAIDMGLAVIASLAAAPIVYRLVKGKSPAKSG